MNKGKKSVLNAATAMIQMVIVSILGLVLTRTIITKYGSDYNGINSTVNQIVNAIMVLEGGFTLASNVALFAPFSAGNHDEVNAVLAATSKRFKTVGFIALIIGILFAFLFPVMVSSTMPAWMISMLMITVLLPSCFNLGLTMRYRVLILTDQREYIISIITTITYILGCVSAILIMNAGKSLLTARMLIAVSLFLCYFGIIMYCRYRYPWHCFSEKPAFDKIKGTKSVLVLKLTSMFYLSFPIIVISTLPDNGTMIASVYAVYRSVVTVISNGLASLTNAPRLGFGALFAEGRTDDAEAFFYQYEKITCIALSAVLGTTCLLLMPFIELYTSGVTDISYVDKKMAAIMLFTVLFETLHIPSGQMIQMKGDFTASRKIQSISCIVLVVAMVIGRFAFGIYGIISAVFLAAVVIAVMEIFYTGRYIFNRSVSGFLKNTIPCIVICIITMYAGFAGIIHCNSYIVFCVEGIVSLAGCLLITAAINCIVDIQGMIAVTNKVESTFRRGR